MVLENLTSLQGHEITKDVWQEKIADIHNGFKFKRLVLILNADLTFVVTADVISVLINISTMMWKCCNRFDCAPMQNRYYSIIKNIMLSRQPTSTLYSAIQLAA